MFNVLSVPENSKIVSVTFSKSIATNLPFTTPNSLKRYFYLIFSQKYLSPSALESVSTHVCSRLYSPLVWRNYVRFSNRLGKQDLEAVSRWNRGLKLAAIASGTNNTINHCLQCAPWRTVEAAIGCPGQPPVMVGHGATSADVK